MPDRSEQWIAADKEVEQAERAILKLLPAPQIMDYPLDPEDREHLTKGVDGYINLINMGYNPMLNIIKPEDQESYDSAIARLNEAREKRARFETGSKKAFSFESLNPFQPKFTETETGHKKMKGIPFPDPLGVLENITDGAVYDPIMQGMQIKKEADTATESLLPEDRTEMEVAIRKDVDDYVMYLRKAYAAAPCPGCKKLVESALVGAEVYREMERTGKSVKEVKEDVENIRKRVMEELHGE
jgi:hypothetical protein